jgi:acyl carrier protein
MKTDEVQAWSEIGVFVVLKDILPLVAPLKVTASLFPETSLSKDLDFDSLDTIEMLIAVNKEFRISLDFETWLSQECQREDKPFTVKSLCQFIMKTLEET